VTGKQRKTPGELYAHFRARAEELKLIDLRERET